MNDNPKPNLMKRLLAILLLLLPQLLSAQRLLETPHTGIQLSESVEATLLAAGDCRQCFYYLPVNLRLSMARDSTPEVSFISWKNDENTEVIGGILHFLMTWGLDGTEEEKLQRHITSKIDSTGVLMGAVSVQPREDNATIAITGKHRLTETLNRSVTSKASISTTPASKMALSFRFNGEGARQLLEAIREPDKIDTAFAIELVYAFIPESGIGSAEKSVVLQLPLKKIMTVLK